ncbi:GNAT family N-acetyltransferase [Marinilactibacillus psychrotolerans]|uniref:Acetyltransferase n=2 Tax=Marinilactibacillus psychrotolerans TaxID=191770 RepID=A0AAV3WV27_9LACT|nr:GNAT family N-acetyltransferase [Marinilactibacillus psychrotolerans]GEL67734.1 hypothetical protein MPS01_18890 [Marinilactibacillus psychrotolerans]GEQ35596.1 acetyltransferase [Marinilactibacillus psychrotolerans]SDC69771.1 putative acetyltransferase [Marinilactibacillus psychrotolerans]
MIEKKQKLMVNELETISNIWLDVNIEAHHFIKESYWTENYISVKESLNKAIIYLYKQDGNVYAFLGMVDNYIAGIFVDKRFRKKGIGKELLSTVKKEYKSLELSVYVKNVPAINFYLSQGFNCVSKELDSETLEEECKMQWISSVSYD